MSSKTTDGRLPELREFVKENDQSLYSFCFYLLPPDYSVEELVLQIFRDFGDRFRQNSGKREGGWEAIEMRIGLFTDAWDRVREVSSNFSFTWALGRDTRALKGWDANLLKDWEKHSRKGVDLGELEPSVLERLRRVDLEVRAPLVLRDILRFEDEEVVRILGVRWGVYRHRLHRGRLDFKDLLQGRSADPIPSKPEHARDNPW